MIGFLRLKYLGCLPWMQMSKRTFNHEVRKPAFHDAGVWWHRTMRPKHFTHAGASEYAYAARSERYEMIKLKKFGHTYPLVYRGEGQSLTRMRDVRSTFKGFKVVLRANKFNFRPTYGRIQMRDELTRVTQPEANELTRLVNRSMDARIRQVRVTHTEEIR